MSFLKNYKVSVKATVVKEKLSQVVVHHLRAPGTNSTIAHASIDGFELAVATSPCVDPRNFSDAIGVTYSTEKVLRLAEDKLWEIEGMGLYWLLMNRTETDEEFFDKYKDRFVFTPIEQGITYKDASESILK